MGKSFRNEITTEHFIFRSCEFEQMEMEFFVEPEAKRTGLNIGVSYALIGGSRLPTIQRSS